MRSGTSLALVGALAALLLVSGCTTWHDTMTFVGLSKPNAQATAPASAAAANHTVTSAAVDTGRCRDLAEQAKQHAANNGFDMPTQRRRYDVTYRQCLALSGH